MLNETRDGIYFPEPPIPFYPKDEHGDVFISKHQRDFDYESPSFVYRPKNFSFRAKRFFARLFAQFVSFFVFYVYYGFQIRNRKVYRRHKKELQKGYISVCNHVFSLDCLGIALSRAPHCPEFPMWKDGFESSLGAMLQCFGGFPVVRTIHGIARAYRAMKEVVKEKKWLQVYPEAACWFYYVPVREFENGSFRLAYEIGAPILPMGYSFRKRRGFFRLFGSKTPLLTLSIGEPLYADRSLSREEAVKKLLEETHLSVLHLCGIADEKSNEEYKKLYVYGEGLVTNLRQD